MQNILIKNPGQLQQKIQSIKKDGINKLHIISDFDKTLTTAFRGGKKHLSTIALIRDGNYLTEDYPPKAYALFDKYHPFEIDDSLDLQTKKQKMHEWWSEHEKLLVASGMNKGIIEDLLQKYPDVFRKGSLEFLDTLHKNNIPLLIFSSGLGDMIEAYLKKEEKLTENLFIISNFWDFDNQGKAKGYKSDIVHVFNKDETQIQNKPYLEKIKERTNLLLLGDSLGDLGMSEGLHHNESIKIGFLNNKIEEKKELYQEHFDIVITEDGTMDYVNKLMKELIS